MNFSELKLPSNRKFGLFFTAVFAITAAYCFYQTALAYAYFLGVIAAALLLATLTKADLLLPLNKAWMRLGLLLGMIVSPIVLGMIFFLLFTPIGLLMRLFGRDELRLKLTARASHWRAHCLYAHRRLPMLYGDRTGCSCGRELSAQKRRARWGVERELRGAV